MHQETVKQTALFVLEACLYLNLLLNSKQVRSYVAVVSSVFSVELFSFTVLVRRSVLSDSSYILHFGFIIP
jgi:hypothetical protein